jgi:hypothetical protein
MSEKWMVSVDLKFVARMAFAGFIVCGWFLWIRAEMQLAYLMDQVWVSIDALDMCVGTIREYGTEADSLLSALSGMNVVP